VGFAALAAHGGKFGGDFAVQIVAGGAGRFGIIRNVGPAGLVDGAQRELGIARRVQLPHQYDIELAVEALRDELAHRHRAPRNREDERILPAPLGQGLGQQ